MQWGSVAEFFAMGGYGLYVWPSFGVAALCMGGRFSRYGEGMQRLQRAMMSRRRKQRL